MGEGNFGARKGLKDPQSASSIPETPAGSAAQSQWELSGASDVAMETAGCSHGACVSKCLQEREEEKQGLGFQGVEEHLLPEMRKSQAERERQGAPHWGERPSPSPAASSWGQSFLLGVGCREEAQAPLALGPAGDPVISKSRAMFCLFKRMYLDCTSGTSVSRIGHAVLHTGKQKPRLPSGAACSPRLRNCSVCDSVKSCRCSLDAGSPLRGGPAWDPLL